ncbi:MAG: HDOD domain-containing protein [Rhodoferax sp.]|nr:HDOD domain-containing protein [Rhodoferax sp.]
MNSTSRPVFFHLLADQQLAPGAVLLCFSEPTTDTLQLLSSQPDFLEFATGFPCLLAASQASGLAPEVLSSLQSAGCVVTDDALIYNSDELTIPQLPPPALWIDGNWYQAPPPRANQAQSASRTLALKLLQLVNEDADTRDIEDVLRQDPTLSYQLLRLVNSLGMGATRPISSFSQAILILGRTQLRRWINLMLFAARTGDHRAPMLLAAVSLRARTMELLAKECGLDRADQDQAFMAGMFSMLGVLFGTPLAELIKPLQLSDALVNAITGHRGTMGELLQALEYAAQRDATGLTDWLDRLQLSAGQFTLASLSASQWMLEIAREVKK